MNPLKELIKERGIKLLPFAEEHKPNYNTLYKAVNQPSKRIPVATAYHIAIALEVPVESILPISLMSECIECGEETDMNSVKKYCSTKCSNASQYKKRKEK